MTWSLLISERFQTRVWRERGPGSHPFPIPNGNRDPGSRPFPTPYGNRVPDSRPVPGLYENSFPGSRPFPSGENGNPLPDFHSPVPPNSVPDPDLNELQQSMSDSFLNIRDFLLILS